MTDKSRRQLFESEDDYLDRIEEPVDLNDLPEAAEGHADLFRRGAIRQEVVQEIVDYIDGDAENGPRFGVKVTDDEIEAEVERRIKFLRQPAFEYEEETR